MTIRPRILCHCLALILYAITLLPLFRYPDDRAQASGLEALKIQRLGPPPSIICPRNQLTVYEGWILDYSRTRARTSMRIRTEAETTESVIIRHDRVGNPAKWFLLKAEPFKEADWNLIESRRGVLRPKIRAHIWVCTDGSNPIVDWRPPEE